MKVIVKKKSDATHCYRFNSYYSTDNLYHKYNFESLDNTQDVLISATLIENLAYYTTKDYFSNKKLYNEIIKLAKTYEVYDRGYNFNIDRNGKITLGNAMKKIKNDIESYEKYINDIKNNEHTATVELKIGK